MPGLLGRPIGSNNRIGAARMTTPAAGVLEMEPLDTGSVSGIMVQPHEAVSRCTLATSSKSTDMIWTIYYSRRRSHRITGSRSLSSNTLQCNPQHHCYKTRFRAMKPERLRLRKNREKCNGYLYITSTVPSARHISGSPTLTIKFRSRQSIASDPSFYQEIYANASSPTKHYT